MEDEIILQLKQDVSYLFDRALVNNGLMLFEKIEGDFVYLNDIPLPIGNPFRMTLDDIDIKSTQFSSAINLIKEAISKDAIIMYVKSVGDIIKIEGMYQIEEIFKMTMFEIETFEKYINYLINKKIDNSFILNKIFKTLYEYELSERIYDLLEKLFPDNLIEINMMLKSHIIHHIELGGHIPSRYMTDEYFKLLINRTCYISSLKRYCMEYPNKAKMNQILIYNVMCNIVDMEIYRDVFNYSDLIGIIDICLIVKIRHLVLRHILDVTKNVNLDFNIKKIWLQTFVEDGDLFKKRKFK